MTEPVVKIGIELEDRVTTALDKVRAASVSTAMGIADGFAGAGTAVVKVRENMEGLGGSNEKFAAGVEKVRDSLGSMKVGMEDMSAAVAELEEQLKPKEDKDGMLSIWDFYSQKFHEFKELLREESDELSVHAAFIEELYGSRKKVVESAYAAMNNQMLNYIETGEFSVRKFGDIIMQQVKIELAGLAARAAVNALFMTAVGLGRLVFGDAVGATTAFQSAAFYAAASAATVTAAKGVQLGFFGGSGGSAGSSASGGSSTSSAKGLQGPSGGTVPLSPNTNAGEGKPVQHITVNIHNPLSEQNWTEIAENNIAPALEGLKYRNVEVSIISV